jgi:hypothetical protein
MIDSLDKRKQRSVLRNIVATSIDSGGDNGAEIFAQPRAKHVFGNLRDSEAIPFQGSTGHGRICGVKAFALFARRKINKID